MANPSFQVSSEIKLRVRSRPSLQSETIEYLDSEQIVQVQPAVRVEAEGHVWRQTDQGWCAERALDTAQGYLQAAKTPAKPAPVLLKKTFLVGDAQVRVRSAPGLSGESITFIDPGQTLEVDPHSRTEADGYVWWQHSLGWSAERSLDGSDVFLTASDTAAPTRPGRAVELPVVGDKKAFQVGSVPVRVRGAPGLSGEPLGQIDPGQTIGIVPNSRTEADGYVWWQHSLGWSAERTTNGKEIYLFAPGESPVLNVPSTLEGLPDDESLPMRNQLFKLAPVPLARVLWWQYFGNNVFAYDYFHKGWYNYCQGLHGGLDYGNSSQPGVQVFAGVEGVFQKCVTHVYRPNGLFVTAGNYTIIYGHMVNPPAFQPGQPIGPDTFMGVLDYGPTPHQNHLHLEVRYKNVWIVNPLLLMSEEMRNAVFVKFPPGPHYFYRDATWNKWQMPLDQPALKLSGPTIGPHAR